jgi:hypothetical protein
MPQYLLAPDVHLCCVGESVVMLDLRSNSYVAVDPDDVPTLGSCLIGVEAMLPPMRRTSEVGSTPEDLAAALMKRGLITTLKAVGHVPTPVSLATNKAIPPGLRAERTYKVQLTHVIRFFRAFLYVAWNLRRKRIKQLVDRQARMNRDLRLADCTGVPERVRDLLLVFRRLRLFAYTAHDQCLLDSLVLAEFLRSNGEHPIFCIGVKSKPFLAHAWVQVGDCVLDDTLDHVRNVAPILAV